MLIYPSTHPSIFHNCFYCTHGHRGLLEQCHWAKAGDTLSKSPVCRPTSENNYVPIQTHTPKTIQFPMCHRFYCGSHFRSHEEKPHKQRENLQTPQRKTPVRRNPTLDLLFWKVTKLTTPAQIRISQELTRFTCGHQLEDEKTALSHMGHVNTQGKILLSKKTLVYI